MADFFDFQLDNTHFPSHMNNVKSTTMAKNCKFNVAARILLIEMNVSV